MAERVRRYELLARTAARKSPRQFVGILSRKARNRVVPRVPVDVDNWYSRRIPADLHGNFFPHKADNERLRNALSEDERGRFRRLTSGFLDGRMTFLNQSREIPEPASVTPDDERIDGLPRLWYLKLAAFEPLRWGVLGGERLDTREFRRQADDWIEYSTRNEAIASRVGYLRGYWTPYSVSHRIVTLCRYAAWRGGLEDSWVRFLYKSLLFLRNNVEDDVGGNHVLENGAALVVGGLAFPQYGSRFVQHGLDILESEVEKQFLDDGYHYERSPMYHLAVTTRLLTVQSVFDASSCEPPLWLVDTVTEASRFTEYLRSPDGHISLLNDSVFDEAERLSTVAQYARAVDIDVESPMEPGESGLHWFDSQETTMLADAGDSGPLEQLGHVHNDPCTFVAWSNERRMITDTGTFHYQPGDRRQFARSVTAHNTVQVADDEPVEYGSRFLMSDAIRTTTATASAGAVDAMSSRYRAGDSEPYDHRRTWYAGPDWHLVWDEVDTEGSLIASRLCAHPAVSIDKESAITFIHEDGPRLFVTPFGVEDARVETAPYYPRFGEELERPVVEFLAAGRAFGFFLCSRNASIDLDRTGNSPETVTLDGTSYTLPKVMP